MGGRVYYNKLIRDKIPEKIKRNGEECDIRILDDDQEFEQELLKKIGEEARGLAMVRDRDSFTFELADLLEVIDALKGLHHITDDEVVTARTKNQEEKGKFTERFFLRWSSDSDYASNESPQGIRR